MHTVLLIWLIGVAIIWIATPFCVRSEPTAHGQSILWPMGCILGVVWPLYLAWMALLSPYLLFLWWKGELG